MGSSLDSIRFVRDGDCMALGPEYEEVELPLLDQLIGMGWTHLEGAPPGTPAPTDPKKSGRASFSEVILESRLRAQLRVINKDNHGKPWLDERRIGQAVAGLTRLSATSLLEANQKATELLINGTTVEGLPGWDGGRDQRIQYIDWENWDKPHANDFVVVSQFRVDIPGTQSRKCIVPDEVLFVNGIPLALVECKKPGSPLKRRSTSICGTPTAAAPPAGGKREALPHCPATGSDQRRQGRPRLDH